jgi:hypothetical protein
MIICLYVLIIPEEKYLTAKFGGEHKEYTINISNMTRIDLRMPIIWVKIDVC